MRKIPLLGGRHKLLAAAVLMVIMTLSTMGNASATDITGYSVRITDKVTATGNIVAIVNDGVQNLDRLPSGVYIEWYKSSNEGNTWERIPVSDEDLKISVMRTGGARREGSPAVWYKARICNDAATPVTVSSDPYKQTKYWGMLRNGSFENPKPEKMYDSFHFDEYPEIGWNDIFNSVIEIGTHKNQPDVFSKAYRSDQGSFKALEGEQISEVESETYGSLYQTILTEPGTELTWSLYHCSRYFSGYSDEDADKMYVVCLSEEDAVALVKDVDMDHAYMMSVIQKIIAGTSKYKSARAWVVETPLKDVWKQHSNDSDPYIVPAGQYYTRLFFCAASSISGSSSAGNLLDAVSAEAVNPGLGPVGCPWCDLQEAINNAASGATITLTKDYRAKNRQHYHGNSLKQTDSRLMIPAGKSITIDLNGHTIDRNLAGSDAVALGNVFTVEGGASLTVTDSSVDSEHPYGKGRITGGFLLDGNGGGIYVENGAEMTLKSGNICNNRSAGICNKGTLTIAGGSIIDNTNANHGGGVWNDGEFTMRGGIIKGNRSKADAGGVYNHNGTFSMTGGEISGNFASHFGGAIANEATIKIEGGTFADNHATNAGAGIYQKGTMILSGAPAFGTDQDVYLPSVDNPTDITRSTYVITKGGEIGNVKIPVVVANEVTGRDILVSKKGESSNPDIKVVKADLAKLAAKLQDKKISVIFNAEGRDGGLEPESVVELAFEPVIIIRRTGLCTGEDAIYNVYYKAKEGDAFSLRYVVPMNADRDKPAGKDYAERRIVKAEPGIYKVEETFWNWSYAKEITDIVIDGESVTGGAKGMGTGTVDYNQKIVFTFSGAKTKDKPMHDESISNNGFEKYGKIEITIDIEDWNDGGKKKIVF